MSNSDKKRLDLMDVLASGYGNGWVLRYSSKGRGLRLHETSGSSAFPTVREAIDDFLLNNEGKILDEAKKV
jgi:hypothetical protein